MLNSSTIKSERYHLILNHCMYNLKARINNALLLSVISMMYVVLQSK
jgi:hypothetical protein